MGDAKRVTPEQEDFDTAITSLRVTLSAKARECERYRAALEAIAVHDRSPLNPVWHLGQIARAALAGDGAGEDPPVACGTFQSLPEVPCKCSASPTGKNRGWRVHLAAACYPTTGEWRAAEAEARRKSVGG